MKEESDIKNLTPSEKDTLLDYLLTYLTPQRIKRFKQVLNYRTRHLTLVAEDTFRDHNASALIRTCDCFGIQDMHIIEENNAFHIATGMAKGAEKWVDKYFYNDQEDNVQTCIDRLKDHDYRIIATTPHKTDKNPENFDIQKPAALFFGKEKEGLAPQIMDQADDYIKIPMVGFTESFNISVSAAIILHTLTNKLHHRDDIDWKLNNAEILDIKIDWCLKTIQNSSHIAARFLEEL